MADIDSAVEAVFRQESGRIVATLIRISGSFDRAEEAMQEAFTSAISAWLNKGVPTNPAAWVMATAHRKLIDAVRRENTRKNKENALSYETSATTEIELEAAAMEFRDDRLRLIFTCCHPALNEDARVALTLRTLGGLSTPEIAKAFLLPEATLAQRLVRAKRKIQEARIPYEEPSANRLPERLASVQAVIYLIFNEGYSASSGQELVRSDLCAESIRLGRVLCELLPNQAESLGLLALMLLHDSRRNARMIDGALVTLEEQNRALWNGDSISEGVMLVEQALAIGTLGPYQLQAAIAALHAGAKNAEETDWRQIALLYAKLMEMNPSPVVALNHAVAVAMSDGFAKGLKRIDDLDASGELTRYHLFHAARADLLRRLDRKKEAAEAYRHAIDLVTNDVEKHFLESRLANIVR